MKDHLIALVQSIQSPVDARNQAREYIQALILNSLQRAGSMVSLAFHGGTALRFLYSIQRFSEDLDFALQEDVVDFDFRKILATIRQDLESQGYEVTIKVNDQKTVHGAFVRFPGLLFELGLSAHQNEVLAVKIEVDTRPPAGADLSTTIVRKHVLLNLQHHDRASLLAGKLHAILQRPYLKGRDVYDLIWYLSDHNWPEPNLVFLNNALAQTNWAGDKLTPNNWRSVVKKRFESENWDTIRADVRPFLSRPEESAFLNQKTLMDLLGS